MNEREELVKADMLTLRSLASLDISTRDLAMVTCGLHEVLIRERRQAQILHSLYDGIVELAIRLGDTWEDALMVARDDAVAGSEDTNIQRAYEKLLHQTEHLFS